MEMKYVAQATARIDPPGRERSNFTINKDKA